MLLDIETSATTWYSKIQNNILLNPNNDSENPDNLAVDQLYCSGSGIVSAYGITNPDYNDIGYNLFFGQAGQGTDYKAYLVNNSGWVFEPMSPFGTDLYNVDPLLTPNNHPQSELSPPVDRAIRILTTMVKIGILIPMIRIRTNPEWTLVLFIIRNSPVPLSRISF